MQTNQEDVFQNDLGKNLRFDTTIDLTTKADMKIYVIKPSGGTAEWTPLGTASGDVEQGETDGTTIITYKTLTSDLAEVGDYLINTWVELADGSKHTGKTVTLRVLARGT